MPPILSSLALGLARRIDPERAHVLALRALRLGLGGRARAPDPMLAATAFGLSFRTPIGLAAGFDKDAVAIAPLARLGFGFVEVGTVTPRPQPGNPRPRLFRLTADRAAINRMGFNNAGIAAMLPRLAAPGARAVPLGVNLGINKEGADPERDYPALMASAAPLADYVVINVSSPNTPGLRDLQTEARLGAILDAIAARVPARPPLLVKIAPDLSDAALAGIVETCAARGVDGLIVSNTTLARPPGLRDPRAGEAGGLSGAPLFRRSSAVLARAWLLARGRLTLIGAGGVFSAADALVKLQAGAALVQLYTGFAYEGPALIPRLSAGLAQALRAGGFAGPGAAVGVDAERIAGWE
ncbi:MAG: quinone-dependent dihydroorotate dehydrogenase [Rhodospirillales bacterium]|nr:quinone-dependent dihydroorotate dehydrogenase [Rhodospirillales bacterium]